MPNAKLKETFADFTGGLNDNLKSSQIGDNQLSVADNITLNNGYPETRMGWKKYSSGIQLTGYWRLYTLYKNDGTNQLLATGDNHLHREVNGEFYQLEGTINHEFTRFLTTKSKTNADTLLIQDGGKLKSWDTEGLYINEVTPYVPTTEETTQIGTNDLANLTNVRAMAIKDGRLIVAAHPSKKAMISFSHIDLTSANPDYTYFPASYNFIVDSKSNDSIIDIRNFRDQLICFGYRNIWSVQGTIDTELTDSDKIIRINTTSGCIAQDTIVEVENSIFYLSWDGVYELYNTDNNFVSARKVSQNIENSLNSIPNRERGKAIYFKGCYYLAFENGQIFVYNYEQQSWVRWTGIKVGGWHVRNNALYFTELESRYICLFQDGLFTDNDKAIQVDIRTKNYHFGYPIDDKVLKELWFTFQQYDALGTKFHYELIADSIVYHDNDLSPDISGVYDEALFDVALFDWQDVVTLKTKAKARGKYIQLKITSDHAGPFVLFNISFKGKVKVKT